MLAYQSYNLKSPLNGEAAQWAEKNTYMFPLDKTDYSMYAEKGDKILTGEEIASINLGETVSCANCGVQISGDDIFVCSSGHAVCRNCAFSCVTCGKVLCFKCVASKCAICNYFVCANCTYSDPDPKKVTHFPTIFPLS